MSVKHDPIGPVCRDYIQHGAGDLGPVRQPERDPVVPDRRLFEYVQKAAASKRRLNELAHTSVIAGGWVSVL